MRTKSVSKMKKFSKISSKKSTMKKNLVLVGIHVPIYAEYATN